MSNRMKDAHDAPGGHGETHNKSFGGAGYGNKSTGTIGPIDQKLPTESSDKLPTEIPGFKKVAAGAVDHAPLNGQDPGQNKLHKQPKRGK